jgi:hypothetical protein
MHSTLGNTIPQFTPVAICEGCGARITPSQDWRLAPNGGYLHRACEVSK